MGEHVEHWRAEVGTREERLSLVGWWHGLVEEQPLEVGLIAVVEERIDTHEHEDAYRV